MRTRFRTHVASKRPWRAASKDGGGKERIAGTAVRDVRYAVVGAGFAGLAACWHLLRLHHDREEAVSVDLYDAVGIAGGASGAAAGLLHPYTPKGKVIWRGFEGVRDTVELIDVADGVPSNESSPFYWQGGIVRPATTERQASDFTRNVGKQASENGWEAELLDYESSVGLLPGLRFPTCPKRKEEPAFAMYIKKGMVIHPVRYLNRLWTACQELARSSGGEASFWKQKVESTHELKDYDGVIVAGGAATSAIREMKELKLPLTFCLGQVLEMVPNERETVYPAGAPSILGSTYLAAQGESNVVVGATKLYGLPASAEHALEMLGQPYERALWGDVESLLREKVGQVYPAISKWSVHDVKQGVRAMPPRTSLGSLPLVGKIPANVNQASQAWFVTGLGARGLVYHAMVGKYLAKAVVGQDPRELPPEIAYHHRLEH